MEIRNPVKEIVAGEKLTYYQIEDGVENLIGIFYAEAPTVATKTSIRFRAYDGKAKLAVDFSEWLNNNQARFPMTVRSLGNAACEVAGLALAVDSFQFESLSIPAFYAQGVTCRQIISWIAQLNGSFVACNTAGEIFFDWYRETDISIGRVDFSQDGLSKKTYSTDLIQRVQFKQETNDVGVIYPADADGNVFSISQNGIAALLDSDTLRSIAHYLFEKLNAVTYTPLSVKLPKRTAKIKVGDIISVTDGNGETVKTYVMKVYLDSSGTQISSTGDQNYADKAAVSSERYKDIPGKVLNIEKSVDGLMVENKKIGEALTKIEVTTKGVDMTSEDNSGKLATFIGNADDGNGGTKGVWKAEYTKNGETTASSGLCFDFSEDEFVFTGKIKGGSININDNFLVDPYGNVQLNGNITWGAGASPTQAVYAASALTKPSNGTKWSSFPASSSGWHQSLLGTDYYASYTYDGGETWTDAVLVRGVDGAQGEKGDKGDTGSTVQIEYLYYRKVTSFTPSTPIYSGGELPTGWTKTPSGVTDLYLYEFVSQCTVTDGKYGTWSTPVLWAKYGEDGSDAEVTGVNVFNALTENGTLFGCFANSGKNELYINANYIQSGFIAADRINAEDLHVKAANIDDTLTANQIDATGLRIKAENVDNLQIGGRNYFTNAKRLKAEIYNPGTLKLDDEECPHGFYVVGSQDGDTTVRFNNVVTENGEWTLSWEMKGSQSVAVGFSVDICDANYPERFKTSADNSWTSHSITVNVANYSADIYNFVDFSAIDWAYIYVRNIKLEKGNKATDWTPAPEDGVVGRNLFLGTGDEISNNDYLLASYAPAGDALVAGKTYTITACVTPGTGVEYLALFLSDGYSENAGLFFDGTSKQIVSKTFVCGYYPGKEPSVDAEYAYANFFRLPNDGTVSSNTTIHWIKIEEGEQSTEWTPAPEDTTELRKEMSELKVTAKGVDMVSENDDGRLVSFIGNGDNGGEWSAKYYDSSDTYKSGLYFDFDAGNFVFDGKVIATSGEIGGFALSDGMLWFKNNSGYIDPAAGQPGHRESFIVLPNFQVTTDGAKLSGGGIGDWTIGGGALTYKYSDAHGITHETSLTTSELEFDNGIASIGTSGASFTDVNLTTSGNYAKRAMRLDYTGLTLNFSNYAATGTFDKHFIVGFSGKTYIKFTAAFGATNKWTGTNARLVGTWSADNDLSDARMKNTIEELPEQYEKIFDGLVPSRYKYNNGTSGRFHTGFIAQEVVSAVENAGLTTQDFAGVMLMDQGTDDEHWYLRRDEFVALNTWQIQKLKARVAELERKLYAVN